MATAVQARARLSGRGIYIQYQGSVSLLNICSNSLFLDFAHRVCLSLRCAALLIRLRERRGVVRVNGHEGRCAIF